MRMRVCIIGGEHERAPHRRHNLYSVYRVEIHIFVGNCTNIKGLEHF